jgi:hypothetical protein
MHIGFPPINFALTIVHPHPRYKQNFQTMIKKLTLLAIACSFTAILTSAQTTIVTPEEKPYIEVTGTAEKEVIPDEIYVSIIIKEKYENRVKITIEEQETKLKDALKGIGIDITNLSLSDANAGYVTIRWQKKDVLTKKDYTLKCSSAEMLGQVFLELEELEIDDAYISRVSHSDLENLKKEVKINAIKDAKAKADYLLAAIGEKTGKPEIIRETDVQSIPQLAGQVNIQSKGGYYDMYEADELSSSAGKDRIQFQKIKIKSSIYTKFLIQ